MRILSWTAAALVLAAPGARAQTSSHGGHGAVAALDSLARVATERTARFADRRVAVAEGYRRLGTDFPGMGEHWLNTGALLAGGVDAGRPTILIYATIAGRPTLLGVGFVVITRDAGDDGAAAVGAPGWPAAWHEHDGLLSDESGAAHGDRRATTTHVWVLHAWTVLDNPAGRFTPDNWALPFARAGLDAPAAVDADVGRAFSLAVGGDEYLRAVLTDAGVRGDTNAARIDAAVAAVRTRAVAVADRSGARRSLNAADVAELRAAWRTLADSLRAAAGPAVEPFLAPPHARHGGMP